MSQADSSSVVVETSPAVNEDELSKELSNLVQEILAEAEKYEGLIPASKNLAGEAQKFCAEVKAQGKKLVGIEERIRTCLENSLKRSDDAEIDAEKAEEKTSQAEEEAKETKGSRFPAER